MDCPRNRCERCHAEEYIPTHQFVKFDEKINYVCQKCWEQFRKWFLSGGKGSNPYFDQSA